MRFYLFSKSFGVDYHYAYLFAFGSSEIRRLHFFGIFCLITFAQVHVYYCIVLSKGFFPKLHSKSKIKSSGYTYLQRVFKTLCYRPCLLRFWVD